MKNNEIKVYKDLMGANEKWAAEIRGLLRNKKITMLNLIGAPGAGKTALLEKSADLFKDQVRFAVLEGDIETTRDAERLHSLRVPVCQLLSGGSCHLEAKLVHHALKDMLEHDPKLVFVENVGNMVCPAEFDIGEDAKVAVLSVTEGEDKPLKYPLLFREAKAVVLTKLDLLPHVPFDLETCRNNLRSVNGQLPVFEISTIDNRGIKDWTDWVLDLIH